MPRMKYKLSIFAAAAFLCGVSSLYAATGAPNAPAENAGKEPPTSWIDPDTGHRVLRLSKEPDSASLYFNQNGYTPDGKRMIYTTPNGVSVVNLETLQTKSVITGRVRTIQVGKKTPSVFYIKPEDHSIYSTNIDTGETKKLAELPPRANVATINADETLAAGTYIVGDGKDYGADRPQQTHPLDQPPNKGQMMEERLAAHWPLVLFTVNLQDGKITKLLDSTDWVNHLLFSPTDPTLLMYCHEGPWQKVDRIWTIRTDGAQNTLIHKRKMEMEIAGHEFWGWNGKDIWYDLQTPKGEDFFVGGLNLDTQERTWYHLQRNEWSIHFNVSPDGTLFCGDGGDPHQVAHAPDGQWIYLFQPEKTNNTGMTSPELIRPGVFHSERLVNMSKHDYHLEPNVSFTPDKKYIVFRSNMFGPTYVFAVEVAKAK